MRSYQRGDYVCVVVLEVKRDLQRLLVGMKCETLSHPEVAAHRCRERDIRLGLIAASSLPPVFQKTVQCRETGIPYEQLLEKSDEFINPTSVDVLVNELGLSDVAGTATLMSHLPTSF